MTTQKQSQPMGHRNRGHACAWGNSPFPRSRFSLLHTSALIQCFLDAPNVPLAQPQSLLLAREAQLCNLSEGRERATSPHRVPTSSSAKWASL